MVKRDTQAESTDSQRILSEPTVALSFPRELRYPLLGIDNREELCALLCDDGGTTRQPVTARDSLYDGPHSYACRI